MSPRGGARAGSGRKKGKRTSESVQITARVKPKTAGKLRAAAKQKLKEERRLRPQRKRLLVGKVLDDLAQQLFESTQADFTYSIVGNVISIIDLDLGNQS